MGNYLSRPVSPVTSSMDVESEDLSSCPSSVSSSTVSSVQTIDSGRSVLGSDSKSSASMASRPTCSTCSIDDFEDSKSEYNSSLDGYADIDDDYQADFENPIILNLYSETGGTKEENVFLASGTMEQGNPDPESGTIEQGNPDPESGTIEQGNPDPASGCMEQGNRGPESGCLDQGKEQEVKSAVQPPSQEKPKNIPTHIKVLDGRFFECICGKRFKTRHHCQYHLHCDGSERPYKCTICAKSFSLRTHFETHFDTHDKPKIECEVCGKKVHNQSRLKTHMRTHAGDPSYNCEKCEKTFANKTSLRNHVKLHENEAKGLVFKCTQCQKGFQSEQYLKKHLERHNSIESGRFHCEICGKNFSLKNVLIAHKSRVHPGQGDSLRPAFQCSVVGCGRTFRNSSSLGRHAVYHQHHLGSKIKYYKCDRCHSIFTRKDNLKRHLQNFHVNVTQPTQPTSIN